ncbi:hypothetical protein NL676_033592 [Syzygium grande]|nr:hypothetical protein NL676_033592 [Syzygium grande]
MSRLTVLPRAECLVLPLPFSVKVDEWLLAAAGTRGTFLPTSGKSIPTLKLSLKTLLNNLAFIAIFALPSSSRQSLYSCLLLCRS